MYWVLAFTVGLLVGSVGALLLLSRGRRGRFLANLARRAKRASRLRSDDAPVEPRVTEAGSMTSGLAHEIKNPLSSVVLNAQLLREGILDANLPEEESRMLIRRVDSLARETARLKDILEDFLKYAGRIHLDLAELDLRDIVEELTDFIHPQCEKGGVLVRADLPRTPVEAHVDVGLLKQALLNLMLNAIQAMESNPSGKRRELIVRLEDSPDTGARVHVIDTGPGIEEHLRAEIFRPYVTTKKGGSGLGLAVAKRIVEEHGGTIDLFTTLGTGTDFVVFLPPVPQLSPASP